MLSVILLASCTSAKPDSAPSQSVTATSRPSVEAKPAPAPFEGDPCNAYPQEVVLDEQIQDESWIDNSGVSRTVSVRIAGKATVHEVFKACTDGSAPGTRALRLELGVTPASESTAIALNETSTIGLYTSKGNSKPSYEAPNLADGRPGAQDSIYRLLDFSVDDEITEAALSVGTWISLPDGRINNLTLDFRMNLPEPSGQDDTSYPSQPSAEPTVPARISEPVHAY